MCTSKKSKSVERWQRSKDFALDQLIDVRPIECAKDVFHVYVLNKLDQSFRVANPSMWSVFINGIPWPSTRNRKAWTSVTYPINHVGIHTEHPLEASNHQATETSRDLPVSARSCCNSPKPATSVSTGLSQYPPRGFSRSFLKALPQRRNWSRVVFLLQNWFYKILRLGLFLRHFSYFGSQLSNGSTMPLNPYTHRHVWHFYHKHWDVTSDGL